MSGFVRSLTLDEAHALLPLVVDGLNMLRGLLLEERTLRGRIRQAGLAADPAAPPPLPDQARLEEVGAQAQACLDRIHALGAQVKGVEPFLVDFPAQLDGVPVLLCWREGEERITHYHGLDTGFASRKPIARAQAFGPTVLH